MLVVIGKVIGGIVLAMFGAASISAGLRSIETYKRLRRYWEDEQDRDVEIFRHGIRRWVWWISLGVLSFCAIAGGIYLAVSAIAGGWRWVIIGLIIYISLGFPVFHRRM